MELFVEENFKTKPNIFPSEARNDVTGRGMENVAGALKQ